MEIVDLEREEDWLDLMGTTLTFVFLALPFCPSIELIRFIGRAICRFLERVRH